MNDHEFEEWVKRADYNHDALIAEVTRLQQARADDTVLLGTVAAERDAAITRAERAGQALALAEQSIASATGGVYCTQCGDQLVTDGDDNLCWVCVGTLKSRVEAAEREVASEAKRADAMSRSALANYDQVVALNVALATAERERDEARQRANEQEAEKEMESHAADVWEMDCKKAEADRDAWKAKAEAADAELPPLPEGWREVPTCGAVRTYMCVNHAYRYVEVFLDGTVRISWALDLPTAITVLRHAEQAHQELKEGK